MRLSGSHDCNINFTCYRLSDVQEGKRSWTGGRFCLTGYQLWEITQGREGLGSKFLLELPHARP